MFKIKKITILLLCFFIYISGVNAITIYFIEYIDEEPLFKLWDDPIKDIPLDLEHLEAFDNNIDTNNDVFEVKTIYRPYFIGDLLKKDKNYFSTYQDPEHEKKVNNIKNEINKLDDELRKLETAVTEYRLYIDELEKKMLNEKDPLQKKYYKNSIKTEKKELKKKTNHLSSKTKDKANLYKELEKTGDPVDVSSGKFTAEVDDFEAQDFFEKFSLSRYLNYGNSKTSFGENWICSLDERIIRCNYKNVDDEISRCKEILSKLCNMKQRCNNTCASYDYVNGRKNSIYKDANELEIKCKKILEKLIEIDKTKKELDEKNKYVLYGDFVDYEKHPGDDKFLIYVTESGQKIIFEYDNNGSWSGSDELKSLGIIIKNLNSDEKYSEDKTSNGGYEVSFNDGSKRIFSEYGILTKVIDRNGNETKYKNINGKISEIELKTGEILKIDRNDKNFITSISGNVSGSAYYFYSSDRLSKVINNKNIEVGYEYNDNGNLISIQKNNNSKIKIEYNYDSVLKDNVCTAVTNPNNDREEFMLDSSNKVMKHNVYGYGNEIFKFDDSGNTTFYSDLQGNTMECEYDSYGNILSISKNGIKKRFGYDDKFNTVSITYNDGSTDLSYYDEKGFITKVVDRDGNSNSYEYDEKGNTTKILLGSTECGRYWYYPNGLLKGYGEGNKTVEFKYNEYGNVIEKKEKVAGGKVYIYTWKYDDKNRLIESVDYAGRKKIVKYDGNTEIIVCDNRKVTNLYNNRGYIIQQEDEDLQTGEKHVKKNIYDSLDNIIKVYVDNALLSEYEYYKNGVLKSFTVWNNPTAENKKDLFYGIKTEYLYDAKWRKSEEVISKIKDNKIVEQIIANKYTYTKQNKNLIVREKKYLELGINKTYNEEGKLIKEEWDNGYCVLYTYSKAGKILTKKDNRDNLYQYKYLSDGSYKVLYQNFYGGRINYTYNNLGQLINIKDYYGYSYFYEYDTYGNLISVNNINSKNQYKYDDENRLVSCILYEDGKILSEYSVEYDDRNNTKTVYSGGYIESIEKYNCWGMLKELKYSNGHYFFDYDYLGNCRKITDYYGCDTIFEYSPDFNVILEKKSNGDVKKYEFGLSGILKSVYNNGRNDFSCLIDENFVEKKQLGSSNRIELSKNGNNSKLSFYDTGEYYREKNQNGYSIKDDNNNIYKYETDRTGNVIKEINPNGDITKFSFGRGGELIEKINPSGIVEKYNYNKNTRTNRIEYSTGEVVEFVCNISGNITKVNTNNYSLEYEYDKGGNLISEYSKETDTRINYSYDSFSRCIKKSGANFSFLYSYDELGRLIKMEDEKTGDWASFEYDNLSRIVNQKYSNGMETKFGYNEFGQQEYYVTKNRIGSIISGDFFLYDDYGRIRIKADAKGNISQYKYSDKGHLISSEYPYSDKKRDAYLAEASECGFYIKNINPKTTKLNLSNNDVLKIKKLYDKGEINGFMGINLNQNVWCEKYNYNQNGSIKSIENPYGEIEYNYDSLNRIISKNYKSTNENGVKLRWNKDNCLEEVESKQNKYRFSYNALKRPVKVEKEDFINKNHEIIEYKYDGFGRRVIEKYKDTIVENIYDGFSTILLSKQCITNNGFVSSLYSTNNYSDMKNYRNNISDYNESSSYRMVESNKYSPYGEVKQYSEENQNINKFSVTNTELEDSNRNSYSVLSLGSTPILYSYVDGSKYNDGECEFLICDYRNKITGSFDNNSDCIKFYEYDTWGNCVTEKSEFFINFGFRDYVPSLKSFTTEDPIRDGMNWFAYCPCDPINYCDVYGFLKQSYSMSDNLNFQANMYDFINFFESEFKNPANRDIYNCYMGLYGAYDCVDNVMAAINIAMRKSGLLENSEYMKRFAEFYFVGNMQRSKDVACSADIYSGRMGRKVCGGMDSEYFNRIKEMSDEDKKKIDKELYKTKDAERNEAIKNLRDPNIIQPGTVLVWKNSKYNRDKCPNSCGHGVVVVSRKFDENGNMVGFYVLQGHTGGVKDGQTLGEQTELTYIDVSSGYTDVHGYLGEFAGVYEMEDPNAPKKAMKCVM